MKQYSNETMERGVALYLAIMLMSLFLAMSFSIGTLLLRQLEQVKGLGDSVLAFYAADTGIERVLYDSDNPQAYYPQTFLDNQSSYEVWVTQPQGGTMPGIPGDSACKATGYCIKSVGLFGQTKRAIEIKMPLSAPPECVEHTDCGLCEKCVEGACVNQDSGEDLKGECGDGTCCGYCNGSGACTNVTDGSTCSSPGDSCTAIHYRCNGGGSCTAPTTTGWSSCVSNTNDSSGPTLCSNAGYDGCDDLWYCVEQTNCTGTCYTGGYDAICASSCKHITTAAPTTKSCHYKCLSYVYD